MLGVAASVLAGYAGIIVGLIHSITVADAVAWGIIISALGLIVGLLVDIHVAVSDEAGTLEIIEGQGALMRAYEDLRRTEGATLIQAIWATRYPSAEIESYFAAERADLLRSGAPRIERLIAVDVLDADVMSKLRRHGRGLPNLTLWEIEPVVLECNLCEYVRERTSYMKALVVLAGAEKTAQVAVYMDTRREPGMVGVVYSLKGWFEGLKRVPLSI